MTVMTTQKRKKVFNTPFATQK